MSKLRDFTQDLRDYMEAMHPGVCFYGFGSAVNAKVDAAPRDLDGGLIFPEIVTDKDVLLDISRRKMELVREYEFDRDPCQFNVSDVRSGRDGRFISYDTTFTHFIGRNGVVFSGPDYINAMVGHDNKYGPLDSAAFNFRYVRNSFFDHVHLTGADLKERLSKSLEKLRILPRKLFTLWFLREYGETEEGLQRLSDFLFDNTKGDSARRLPEILPGMDLTIFNEVVEKDLADVPDDDIPRFWGDVLTAYEIMTEGYISRYPGLRRQVTTVI